MAGEVTGPAVVAVETAKERRRRHRSRARESPNGWWRWWGRHTGLPDDAGWLARRWIRQLEPPEMEQEGGAGELGGEASTAAAELEKEEVRGMGGELARRGAGNGVKSGGGRGVGGRKVRSFRTWWGRGGQRLNCSPNFDM